MTRARLLIGLSTLPFAVALLGGNVRAQETPIDSNPRIRIRETGRDTYRTGTLVELSADSVAYHPGLGPVVESLSLSRVRSVERSTGLHPTLGHIAKTTLMGGAIGIEVGVLIAGTVCHFNPSTNDCLGATIGAVGLALAGVVGGALVGTESVETWSVLYPREQSLVPMPLFMPAGHGRVSVGMSMAFDERDLEQP